MDGHPLPIVTQNEETKLFELDEEALASVLLRPEVAHKHVCVLTVAGAFRKGKTFLLDFLRRYCANRGDDNWLGNPSSAHQGFKWRQGPKRETTGILIWSEPFLVTRDDGDEMAVILMDTQGTFDLESSRKDSTVVFALSLLASSVLVYNLTQNVQEDDLTNLQAFINYGIQALDGSSDSSVYQKLWFLVRDWGHSAQLPYGAQGGQQLKDDLFQVTPQTRHRQLRTDVLKCFEDIACYLMPHPGPQTHENVNFCGKLNELDEKFVDHLKQLVPLLLAPKNLVVKKLGGHAITARDLFSNFKSYVDVFKSEDLPEPRTVAESMTIANSQVALSAGLAVYTQDMRTFLTVNVAAELVQLEAEHDRMKKEAFDLYKQENKLGRRNDRVFQQFGNQLGNEIAALYNAEFRPLASSRSALRAAKEQYVTAMAAVAADGRPPPQMDVLRSAHEVEQERAIQCYRQNNECGETNDAIYDKHLELLRKKINTHYEEQLMPPSSSTAALEACKKRYLKVMNTFPMGGHKNQTVKQLKVFHDDELEEAVKCYEERNEPTRKNPGIFKEYLRLLEEEIDKAFTDEYLPMAALLDSWNLYTQAMEGYVKGSAVRADEDLSYMHEMEKKAAIYHYTAKTKPTMNEQNVKEYKEHLEKALPELFKMIKDVNTAKRVVNHVGTAQHTRSFITTSARIGFELLRLKVPVVGTVGSIGTSLGDLAFEKLVRTKKNVADATKKYEEKKDTQVETWLSLWNTNKQKRSENL